MYSSCDTVPVTPNTNGLAVGSLVEKLTRPPKDPNPAASRRTLNVVTLPGASVVAVKPETRLNPTGNTMGPSTRSAEPALRTLKVWTSAAPGSVRPKATCPDPPATAAEPSTTSTCGPALPARVPTR